MAEESRHEWYCKFCSKPISPPTMGLKKSENSWSTELLDINYAEWVKNHGVCQQCREYYTELRYISEEERKSPPEQNKEKKG